MTQTRSSTSSTSRNEPASASRSGAGGGLILFLLIIVALALRILRIDWQPLWWDEGYSVYFATESLTRMATLTAGDIHPPLFYGLLHGWISVLGSTLPSVLRVHSVLLALPAIPLMAMLAGSLFGNRRRLPLIAALLLVVSPIHLFYSQEIRMYGLAMVLGMAATLLLWHFVQRPGWPVAVGYVLVAALALYTLYYLALLMVAHLLWGGWQLRTRSRRLLQLAGLYAAIGVAFLPWLLYAGPSLAPYVSDKIGADNDTPLNLLEFVWRHLLAFTGGHVSGAWPALTWLGFAGVAALLLLVTFALSPGTRRQESELSPGSFALLTFLLVPLALGFLLNLRLPFFPEGGERLMLFVLPYFLLLAALGIDLLWQRHQIGKVALSGFLLAAFGGILIFYSTPRYVERDYRPLIRQIMQQGRADDTVLATFPWQVGYWRAYVPPTVMESAGGPQIALPGEGSLAWGDAVQRAVDRALATGTLWFPMPLSFGSTLPADIEAYLMAGASNIENRWFSPVTRLTAWADSSALQDREREINYGPLSLKSAGLDPMRVASANEIIDLQLSWTGHSEPDAVQELVVTMRLLDADGRTWAQRDYTPPGHYNGQATTMTDRVGLIVPAGLAPGSYTLAIGVGPGNSEVLLQPDGADDRPLQPLAEIQITQPSAPLPPLRLPIQHDLDPVAEDDGLAILGYTGPAIDAEVMAGTSLPLTLFFQNRTDSPPLRHLYVSLLNDDGTGVAGREGWPLEEYPSAIWPRGALVQAPTEISLPAALPTGEYSLIAGFLEPVSGLKSPAAELGTVSVRQRPADFEVPTMETLFSQPRQFGTHAQLRGYDLSRGDGQLHLTLHWQVLQTLLPQHHIFVHLDRPDGGTLGQEDGPPVTDSGPAPSGSWLAGEYLSTQHTIRLPDMGNQEIEDFILRVGLYRPEDNIRLPVTIDGQSGGDSVELATDP